MDWLNINGKVDLIEVGPRDGLQSLPYFVPTSLKIEIINNLIDAGFKNIQITSFVNPNKVPQFKDAEEVVNYFKDKQNIVLHALVLNYRGLVRAIEAGIKAVEVSISANDEFSQKNSNMSFEKALNEVKDIINKAKKSDLYIRGSIQCSFGYRDPYDVSIDNICKICDVFLNEKINEIVFADTTALCNSKFLNIFCDRIIKHINLDLISMHFHSKNNIGLVNLYEAYRLGIRRFDTSFGYIGGCPFIEDSKINVSTEEAINLFNSIGVDTGIDDASIKKCSDILTQLHKQ